MNDEDQKSQPEPKPDQIPKASPPQNIVTKGAESLIPPFIPENGMLTIMDALPPKGAVMLIGPSIPIKPEEKK